MSKYYEQTKSNYAKDVDHLVAFNKNGLWIKENIKIGKRIISADELKDKSLNNITILHLTEKNDFIEKIFADKADISNNQWVLFNVKLFKQENNLNTVSVYENYEVNSSYNYETLHILLTIPFLLMMMTGIASILTLNSLNKTNNLKYILLSFLILIFVFYFKDLFLALGQTGKISLFLSIWSPVLALSFFIFIGVLQINEK